MTQVSNKEVAILVDNYFEQAEFEKPIKALEDAGADITIISASSSELQAMQHAMLGSKFEADLLLQDARSEDYDALILPGGALNSDSLRMNGKAQSWVIDFLDSERLVAAICHAPWLLVSVDAVEERRLTSFYTIQDDIKNAGGEWVDLPVVIDDNLITSRKPDDLDQFNAAIISWLNQQSNTPMFAHVAPLDDNEVDSY